MPTELFLYHGKVYVLTSPSSFSSALMVTDILAVNNIATTVGQLTGLAPSDYGPILPFTSRGSTLVGQYSTSHFQATGPQADAAALTPEIAVPVPLTVRDIQAGINPIRRRLGTLPHTAQKSPL